jgi:hypothetical protein
MTLLLAFWLATLTGLLAVWVVHAPAEIGLRVLAIGIPAQAVVIGLIATPLVGSGIARYVPTWKEALVALLIVTLFTRRAAQGLTVSPNPLLRAVLGVTVMQLGVYAFLPVASYAGVEMGPLPARLAGLRQNLVPVLLLVVGMGLRRAGCEPRRLSLLVLRYGMVIAVIAIAGLVLVPLEFWAHLRELNAGPGELTGTAMDRLNGMQSYFFGIALPRAVAPFASPLTLAFAFIMPVALLWSRRAGQRVRHQGAVVVLALALTQTRSVILAFLLLASFRWLGLRRLHLTNVLVVAAITLLALGPLRMAIVNTASGTDPSSRAHWAAVLDGAAKLSRNPVGVGLGQGGQIGRTLGQQLAGGENLFLVVGNERGWLGLVLTLLLFAMIFRLANQVRRSARDHHTVWLADGLCLATPVVFLASLATEHGIAFSSSWLFWIVAGFVCAAVPAHKAPGAQASVTAARHAAMEGRPCASA